MTGASLSSVQGDTVLPTPANLYSHEPVKSHPHPIHSGLWVRFVLMITTETTSNPFPSNTTNVLNWHGFPAKKQPELATTAPRARGVPESGGKKVKLMSNTSQEFWGQTPLCTSSPTHWVPGWGEPSRHGELSGDDWADVSRSFAPHIHPQSSPSPPLGWASSHRSRRRKLVINYKRRGLGGQAAPHCHPWPDTIYTVSWLRGHRVRPQAPLTCAASCGERGGPSGRKPARRGGTGTAGALCACGSGGSAHRSGRISSHILPRCSGRASRLQRRGGVSGLVGSHPPCAFSSGLPYPASPFQRDERSIAHLCLLSFLSPSVPHFFAFPHVPRCVFWASLPY